MRLFLAAALLIGATLPASATEWVNCADPGGQASFDFLTGTLDVLSVVGMTITSGEKVWASDVAYGPGDPVQVGQAFEDETTVRIDAVDPGVTAKIAELRLFKATEGDATVYAGTLRIAGQGAWGVTCSGP